MTYQFISTLFVCYIKLYLYSVVFTVTSTIYNIFIQSKTQHRYHIFPMLAYTYFSEGNHFYTMILHAYIGDYEKLPVRWDHNTDKHHDKHLPHKTTVIAALSW